MGDYCACCLVLRQLRHTLFNTGQLETHVLYPLNHPLLYLYIMYPPSKGKKGKEEKSKENGGDRVPSWLNES